MSEKRFIVADHSTCVFDKITKEEYVCIDREEAFLVCKRLNKLAEENKQLRTQLLICQQSKNDDGRFQVWQVPPIKIGTKITTSTTFNGDEDEI